MSLDNRCLKILKKDRVKVIIAPLLKLFEVFSELTIPFLIKYIIDKGIKNNDWKYILSLIGIMFLMTVVGFLITMVAQYLASKVSSDYGYRLKDELYQKINHLSEEEINRYGKNKILTLINNDSFMSQNAVMMFMRLATRPIFLILGSTILSFVMDYRAGLIYLAVALLSSFIIFLVLNLTKKKYLVIQSDQDQTSKKGDSVIKGIRVVHAFNKEEQEREDFENITKHYQKESIKIAKINSLVNPITYFLMNLGILLIVYLGKFSIKDGSLTTGEVASFVSYLVAAAFALIMFSRMITSLNKASASNKRINEFLSLPEEKVINKHEVTFDDKAPLIEFQNVYFSYHQNEQYVLEDISFKLNKEDTLGIIGGTGSGKSTIVSLLNRIYLPSKGRILFKGVDISTLDKESYLSIISSVLQKSSIYQGSISSNITLSKKEDTELMKKVLSNSLAEEYVNKFEDGINHQVYENGNNLSGGQKQRLLIARALYKQSELLILDDATSALDYLSDKNVRKNIIDNKITAIFLSQRASTLSSLNHILVLDKGKMIGYGKHDELLKNCPLYKEIFDIQKGVNR